MYFQRVVIHTGGIFDEGQVQCFPLGSCRLGDLKAVLLTLEGQGLAVSGGAVFSPDVVYTIMDVSRSSLPDIRSDVDILV
jgi:hypothetical protein